MNREILFKAKRIDNGEWVEGYYIPHIVGGEIVHHYILTGEASLEETKEDDLVLIFYREEIDANTLCQYTGLTNENGQRIWENDICEIVYDGTMYVYVIVWDKEELDFKGTNGKENYEGNFQYLGCSEEIVVIGNVFDNPELLKMRHV